MQNYTCLHVAVMFGKIKVVNLLLDNKVYYDCTGNDQVLIIIMVITTHVEFK